MRFPECANHLNPRRHNRNEQRTSRPFIARAGRSISAGGLECRPGRSRSHQPAAPAMTKTAVRTTLRRPITVHTIVVGGRQKREKRRGGTELQRFVADMIDQQANDHPDGIEGAMRDFLSGDPIENFDHTIAPSVRRELGNRLPRRRYFATLYFRFQFEIPILIHTLGLDPELSDEAQCLCAVFATAHYLAAHNEMDPPRPDYQMIIQA